MVRPSKEGTAPGVGKRIKSYRKMMGWKGYQFAKVIGISQGSLSDIEGSLSDIENEKSLPSADTLAKLEIRTTLNIVGVLLDTGAVEKLNVKSIDPILYQMINQLTRIYRSGDKYAIGQIKKHFKDIEGRP